MYNDIDWRKEENKGTVISNALEVKAYERISIAEHRSFFGPGTEEQWYGTHSNKPDVFVEQFCGGDDASSQKVDTQCSKQQVRQTEDLWEAKEEEYYPFTATVIRQQQSCCFA